MERCRRAGVRAVQIQICGAVRPAGRMLGSRRGTALPHHGDAAAWWS